MQARVAIVGRDPGLRLLAARAFDAAPVEWTVRLFEEPPTEADVMVVCPDVDAPGIRFDPAHPALVLDEVTQALTRRSAGRVIVVAGASGGAGTTSVALHLSAALATRGSACFLELDRNRGARHRLGLQEDVRTWADAGSTEASLLKAALPIEGSFRVLLMPAGTEDVDVTPLVDRCTRTFRYVVIDQGGTPSSLVGGGPEILVMTPSVPSAKRTRELLDAAPEAQWAVVTNRLGPGSETTRLKLEQILGRPVTLELPCAPGLRDCEDEGRLLQRPWSRWWLRIDRLARALIGE